MKTQPKRTLIAALALMALGASVANANLLSNGDLDNVAVSSQVLATPVGWTATANLAVTGPFNDGMSSEGFANVQQPGGFGLFFKPFQGQATNRITASLSQDNAATPGLSYTLTGWAGAGASYIGLTDPTVSSEFHLQFFNSSSTLIGDTTLNLVVNGQHVLGSPNGGNPFGYFNYSLSALAPAGTVTVRALALMGGAYNNPAGGDQAFVVDSFNLVPEPTSFALLGLGFVAFAAMRRGKAN